MYEEYMSYFFFFFFFKLLIDVKCDEWIHSKELNVSLGGFVTGWIYLIIHMFHKRIKHFDIRKHFIIDASFECYTL